MTADYYLRPKDRPSIDSERQVRFFQTAAGPGGTAYPTTGKVVYAQLMRDLTFSKTPGASVSTGTATGEFEYLGISDVNYPIPPVGTTVAAEKIGARWWIISPGQRAC